MTTVPYAKEMIRSAIQFIQIPGVRASGEPGAPFGKPIARSLEWILNLCDSMGMHTRNFDGYAGMAEIGAGSYEIGILCHLDVVPAEDEKLWLYPPFQGVVEDNRIYGRGAIDDKGPTLAAVYAVRRVLEEVKNPAKRIRLIFFTDEESGWADVPYYLEREKPSDFALVPDGSFPLIYAEKGILHVEICLDLQKEWVKGIRAGDKINMVPHEAVVDLNPQLKELMPEKDRDSFMESLTFTGKGAHASLPEKGENAFLKALHFLGQLEKKLDEPLFFGHLHELLKDCHGRGLKLNLEDHSGRLTLNPGMAEIKDGKLYFSLDIRYPVTFSPEEILSRLESVFIQVREIRRQAPLFLNPESPEIRCLIKAYQEVTGDRHAKPASMGGGTLARAFPKAVAFGAVFPGEEERAHMRDEWMTIDSLIKTHEIYFLALKKLLELPE